MLQVGAQTRSRETRKRSLVTLPAKVCCAVPKIKDHLDGIKSTLCRVCGGEGGDGRTLPEPVGWGVVWRDRMT